MLHNMLCVSDDTITFNLWKLETWNFETFFTSLLVSGFTYLVSCVNCQLSHDIITRKLLDLRTWNYETMFTTPCKWSVACHMWCVACHVEPVICHMSSVACDVSRNVSHITWNHYSKTVRARNRRFCDNFQTPCVSDVRRPVSNEYELLFTSTLQAFVKVIRSMAWLPNFELVKCLFSNVATPIKATHHDGPFDILERKIQGESSFLPPLKSKSTKSHYIFLHLEKFQTS